MTAGPLDINEPEIYSTLRIDAMYFRAAIEQYTIAQASQPKISAALASVEELQSRIDVLTESSEDNFSNYEQLEPLAIQLEGREYELAAAHAPALAAIGSIHVLAAASLEAHINDHGKSRLTGKLWDCFERMATESKWLFFPRIVGRGFFDAGAEPYQSLAKLFNRRNALIHYKPRFEPWNPPGIPEFLEKIGLSLNAAEESLSTVQTAVAELARLLGEDPPYWLAKPMAGGFFGIEFRQRGKDGGQPTESVKKSGVSHPGHVWDSTCALPDAD